MKHTTTFSVASFNVHAGIDGWGRRFDAVAACDDIGADILVVEEDWVADDPAWELCAPRHFSLVCLRLRGDDERNRELLARVNAGGELFMSHAVLDGRYVLRLAIGQLTTGEADIRRAWDALRREAAALA